MSDIAIYCRVSDDKLTDDGSRRQDVNRQIEQLTRYCKQQEWGEPLVFADDGKSAFKEDLNARPEFMRLMREVRANRIKRVVVESLDRWSRRIEHGLRTMRETTEKGCTITSVAEGQCDITEPSGWFKCGVALLLAEWASRSMSFKVKKGMEKRLNDKEKVCPCCGIVHLGRHPLTCRCRACKKRVGRQPIRAKVPEAGASVG